jgi:hypothetical protein
MDGVGAWREIAGEQAGVVARSQLLALGLTPRQARRWIDSGRWRALHPGVYVTFTGPVPDLARVWAALLHAGDGAAAGHRTALWLHGVLPAPGELVEVSVPHERKVRRVAGVRVRRVRRLAAHRHPAARPPRVRLEVALLDVAEDAATEERVVDAVLRAIQQRRTTAERVRGHLRARARHRWRAVLEEILDDAVEGIATALERRFARDVERAHGLPEAARNRPEGTPGRRRYHDIRYLQFALLVELDGREAHPETDAFRDLRRDNAAVVGGDRVLRYGWRDVVGRPCEVAGQVLAVLQAQGWAGRARRCGSACGLDQARAG